MDKDRVVALLEEIGTLLELKGENPFKTRAYSSAARRLEMLQEPLESLVREGRLAELPGIGEALQKKITELVTTGRLEYYEQLKASVEPGLLEMLDIAGLGPKKVKLLHERLGVGSISALEQACQDGKVAALPGFGAKTQAKILEGIDFKRSHGSQHLLSEALAMAEPLLERLRGLEDSIQCAVAGSLRRWKEVVGDLDFVVSSRQPAGVLSFFVGQPEVVRILAHGPTKASVVLEGGMQADLRVVSDAEYASALAYFTGSKEHNIAMRQRAIERGLRLNEYGLFRSKEETRDPELRVTVRTEADIYRELDLAYIPPELREDRGEFELAVRGAIPRLIEWTDLRGSLHNHSNWSDGRQSLEEIAAMAEALGCSYWAITDHSRSSFWAHGLDEERLRAQLEAVKAINAVRAAEGSPFRLLTGSEVDILSDGRLDFSDALLAELDVVVASVHQGFTQDEATMTRRLIRAAAHPHVHMLGHVTGRLLLQREGYRVDQRAVIEACAAHGTWIELNASPQRLDCDWRVWNEARSRGVRCVINCDAHRAEHAGWLRLGAGVARKAGLAREDVVNTRSLAELKRLLAGGD